MVWGMPLPDGRYNTLVFLDAKRVREERGRPVAGIFHRSLDVSGIMTDCRDTRLDGPVRAVDATPYVDLESVTPQGIKVGDAALAIDPLSSSGVQKAIQTALAGAVVANTLIRKPESRAAAMGFYRDTLEQASTRHRAWAAAHYASVARRLGGTFSGGPGSRGFSRASSRARTTEYPQIGRNPCRRVAASRLHRTALP